MLKDRYGYQVSTDSQAACEAYIVGVDALLSANAGAEASFLQAIALDAQFAIAHIALARTLQVQGRGAEAKVPLERARALAALATSREQSQIAIFAKILEGQAATALDAIRLHVTTWPRDAMALAPATSVFGLIGFSGKAGREADQLALLEPLAPHYGDDWWFRTVLAFAEIELQLLARGERNIEAALAVFPRNAHAAHIRSHLYYEAGEREAGLRYLTEWTRDYPREGQIHCHVNWHLALWNLETGRLDEAWRLYADALHPGASWGPQLNVLTDSASFLFRAEIAGEPRRAELWRDLAAYATRWFPKSGVAFADVHSALAYAMAGEGDALGRLATSPNGTAGDVVAPIALGFAAYARGEWAAAVEAFKPVLDSHERVGGSRAQRDLLEYATAGALLRSGEIAGAHALMAARRPQNAIGGFPVAGLLPTS